MKECDILGGQTGQYPDGLTPPIYFQGGHDPQTPGSTPPAARTQNPPMSWNEQ